MQLFIDKYGAKLTVRDGLFTVQHSDGELKFTAAEITDIYVSPSISVSSDAIFLALGKNIPILFIDRKGITAGRIWNQKFGSISVIRKNQSLFCQTTEALELVKKILSAKCIGQQAILISLFRTDQATDHIIENAMEKIEAIKTKILIANTENMKEAANRLRGLEGNASKLYFETINAHLPAAYQFTLRSQHPAHDVFNALLNYAYGILYNLIENTLLKAGVDPAMGIMHRDEYNKPVLVFDVIEQYRHFADFVVIDLCMQGAIHNDHISLDNNAVVLLGPGKQMLVESFNGYMQDTIQSNGSSKKRITMIEEFARKLATRLKRNIRYKGV